MTKYSAVYCEMVAAVCHEANRMYCLINGDDSHLPWAEAPQWQRTSAVNGVYFALEYRRTPEESHLNWMQEKAREGWVYGEKKDEFNKTHPCMVPYAQLSEFQKQKDKLFLAVVNSFKKD